MLFLAPKNPLGTENNINSAFPYGTQVTRLVAKYVQSSLIPMLCGDVHETIGIFDGYVRERASLVWTISCGF